MKSLQNLGDYPAGSPLVADALVELHAARLLLLLHHCGVEGRIDGLLRLARLELFVRHPHLLARACRELGVSLEALPEAEVSGGGRPLDGPWEAHLGHVLAYLRGKRLVTVSPEGPRSHRVQLTLRGADAARALAGEPAFEGLGRVLQRVRVLLGKQSSRALGELLSRLLAPDAAEGGPGQGTPG